MPHHCRSGAEVYVSFCVSVMHTVTSTCEYRLSEHSRLLVCSLHVCVYKAHLYMAHGGALLPCIMAESGLITYIQPFSANFLQHNFLWHLYLQRHTHYLALADLLRGLRPSTTAPPSLPPSLPTVRSKLVRVFSLFTEQPKAGKPFWKARAREWVGVVCVCVCVCVCVRVRGVVVCVCVCVCVCILWGVVQEDKDHFHFL